MTLCPPVMWHVGHDNSEPCAPTIPGTVFLIACNETKPHVLFISTERSKEHVSLHNSQELYGNMTNVAVAVMFTSKWCYIQGHLLGIPHTLHPLFPILYLSMYGFLSGPGSVVSIATGYGLDGPGIESRWGEIFRTCPDRPWGPPSLLYTGYRVFPGG
jgi:hypothetical protein